MIALTLHDVGKIYPLAAKEVMAVTNISLEVATGSFVTIVGRSGCGKTTLLRLIAGLEPASCGTMLFNPPAAKIGLVFQEPRLMPWLTVEKNMAFALGQEPDHDRVEQTVAHYLKMLNLENFRKAYPAQISGGMAQRTSLGRTLCYNPDIILMDEPLGALDAFTRASLQQELIHIFLLTGKTILFVTHDVDEAVLLGQQVLVMDSGRIREIVPIPLAYPRSPASAEFYALRTQVLQAIMTA